MGWVMVGNSWTRGSVGFLRKGAKRAKDVYDNLHHYFLKPARPDKLAPDKIRGPGRGRGKIHFNLNTGGGGSRSEGSRQRSKIQCGLGIKHPMVEKRGNKKGQTTAKKVLN